MTAALGVLAVWQHVVPRGTYRKCPDELALKYRLANRLEATPELCWIWRGSLNAYGYGVLTYRQRILFVHRTVFEILVGPIVPGLDLDHLCRVRSCANPEHLEMVTRRTNLLRGNTITARNAAATRCPRGHEYTPDNIYWDKRKNGGLGRRCRTCQLAKVAARR